MPVDIRLRRDSAMRASRASIEARLNRTPCGEGGEDVRIMSKSRMSTGVSGRDLYSRGDATVNVVEEERGLKRGS